MQDGYFGYPKARGREKRTKSYLSIYLGFFVRVRVRVTTARLPESEDVSLSVRVRVRVRVKINRLPDIKDRKIY